LNTMGQVMAYRMGIRVGRYKPSVRRHLTWFLLLAAVSGEFDCGGIEGGAGDWPDDAGRSIDSIYRMNGRSYAPKRMGAFGVGLIPRRSPTPALRESTNSEEADGASAAGHGGRPTRTSGIGLEIAD
jgi:hypothetical protein